jgi:phage-related minor tail protein
MSDDMNVRMKVDTSGFDGALDDLQRKADLFGRTITTSFKSAATSGQSFGDVLRQLGLNLASMALSSGLKPIQNEMSGLLAGMFGSMKAPVKAFAKGGVVDSPTLFGGGLGLMGEAGPEAIMPLARGADGRLGVAGASGGAAVHVTFNVSTPDAASFRKSEAQLTGMLARAARRGALTL